MLGNREARNGPPEGGPYKDSEALGFRRGWSWGGCGSGRGAEIYFGDFAGAGFGFEVGVVAGEAAEAGYEAVGEERDVGVVVLDGFVVAAALDGDAIFGAGEFVLEAEEIFVGF